MTSNLFRGKVTQVLRSGTNNSNSNQELTQAQINDAYYGKIQTINSPSEKKGRNQIKFQFKPLFLKHLMSFNSLDASNESFYQFGLFSLSDKQQNLQLGDVVSFQMGTFWDGSKKAFNIQVQQAQQQEPAVQQTQQQQEKLRRSDLKKGKIDSVKGHVSLILHLRMNFFVFN